MGFHSIFTRISFWVFSGNCFLYVFCLLVPSHLLFVQAFLGKTIPKDSCQYYQLVFKFIDIGLLVRCLFLMFIGPCLVTNGPSYKIHCMGLYVAL